MGKYNHYKASQFINAIPGTGGIITAIANRVGCSWHTAKKYIEEYATVKRAYNDELELVSDIAESVVIGNIKAAYEKQRKSKEVADSTDAKWYLTRKGKRGYSEKSEMDVTSGGQPIAITTIEVIKDYGDKPVPDH
jgi:hypothetical protein